MTRNRKERYFVLLIIFFYAYLELLVLVSGHVYPSIHWNYENPRFKEGTFRLNVLPNSKLRLICPNIAISQTTREDLQSSDDLFENFWIVDKSSHHSCEVNTSIASNKILLRCDDPTSVRLYYENLVFQSFSAVETDVTFKPGETYYFLSTANGSKESLDSASKGHCHKFNMKMEIYICKHDQDVHCLQPKPTAPVMASPELTTKKTSTSISTTTIETTTVQQIPTSSLSSTQESTTQPPLGPNVGELKKQKDESPAVEIPWMAIVAILLGVLFLVSLVCNIYFWRERKRLNTPDYLREDSRKPLSPPSHV